MTPEQIRLILGRNERPVPFDAEFFFGKGVLVTGADGSIGEALCPLLDEVGADVVATDINELDVRNDIHGAGMIRQVRPDLIFHLAAQKHAPDGEETPAHTLLTNTVGTANIITRSRGAHIILASTCKAVAPETVYGATKLIAERMVLNNGGTVVRLFNVVPASGNVFEIWDSMEDPVPVTDCFRYFISQREAVAALLAAASREPGRYSPDPGSPRYMPAVADDLDRHGVRVPARRGDRLVEPLAGICERVHVEDGLLRVVSHHDEKVRAIA